MGTDIRTRIESTLREVKFHPDFAETMGDLLERLKLDLNGSEAVRNKVAALGYDHIMMTDYFQARVSFLQVLMGIIGRRALVVGDDGCGTGVDLYCLRKLAKKAQFYGADPNPQALARAERRNPELFFDFSLEGREYDLIYSNFVHISGNDAQAVIQKAMQYQEMLKDGGVLVQSTDMPDPERDTMRHIFEMFLDFKEQRPLFDIYDRTPTYLLVWGKK